MCAEGKCTLPYRLFLDDEREPVDDSWVIVRTVEEAIDIIETRGVPEFISFDHDLGEGQKTGYDLAKWLIDWDIKFDILSADNFAFYVHSQNPIGKENIEAIFASYFKFKTI
jgi:hypothetical protein